MIIRHTNNQKGGKMVIKQLIKKKPTEEELEASNKSVEEINRDSEVLKLEAKKNQLEEELRLAREEENKIKQAVGKPKVELPKPSKIRIVSKENIPIQRIKFIEQDGEVLEVITIEEALEEILNKLREI